MKKLGFIFGIAALALVGCSEQGLVNEITNGNGGTESDTPMNFSFSMKNSSRAENTAGVDYMTNYHQEFGVWAVKGSVPGADKVMEDYMVGHYTPADEEATPAVAEMGYKPLANQLVNYDNNANSNWYYEGLGSTEIAPTGTGYQVVNYANPGVSVKENQYIKYWDKEATYTFFAGYVPYNSFNGTKVTHAVSGGKSVLTFPTITTYAENDYMYAFQKEANADHIGNHQTVPMTFNRLYSRIRIAFYGEIKGYDIDVVDLKSTAPEGEATYNGVVAVPAVIDGKKNLVKNGVIVTDEEGNAVQVDKYVAGTFMYSAAPQVTSADAYTTATATVVYTDGTRSKKSDETGFDASKDWFNFATAEADRYYIKNTTGYSNTAYTGTSTTRVNNSKADDKLICSKWINVIPANATVGQENAGLTFNITLKLTAKDTGEIIYVRGARVFVTPDYTQWQANHLYTYIFHITKGINDGDPDPDPEPDPDPALWPIIFDEITVANFSAPEESEWHINHTAAED